MKSKMNKAEFSDSDKEKVVNSEKSAEKDEKGTTPEEIGGYSDQNLPEPTRYGDWEVGGRCSDL